MHIYVLIDPRDESYRYIGRTMDPKRRRKDHLKYAHNPAVPKDWWVRKLIGMGLQPIFRVLMEVPDEIWEEAERATITYYRSIGAPLLNVTDGGDGSLGFNWTDEQKEILSQAAFERWQDPVYRANWEAAMENRDLSYLDDPEFRRRESEAAKKRWLDPEYRERQSEIRVALWKDTDIRQRHAEAMANCGVDFSAVAKQRWQDPEYRIRCAESMERAKPKISENSKAMWKDPKYREVWEAASAGRSEKLRESTNALWEDPEFVEKQRAADGIRSERMKELWADPEWKAEQLESRKKPRSDLMRAAEMLGVSRTMVARYCRQGRLGHGEGRKWIISDEEIEEFAKIPRHSGSTSEYATERWQDPEYRATQAEATRRRYARQTAEQEATGIDRAARILGIHKRKLLDSCRAGLLGRKVDGRWRITDADIGGFGK